MYVHFLVRHNLRGKTSVSGQILPFLKKPKQNICGLCHVCMRCGPLEEARGHHALSFPSLGLGIELQSSGFCSKCHYPLNHVTSPFPSLPTHFSVRFYSLVMVNSSLWDTPPLLVCIHSSDERLRRVPLTTDVLVFRVGAVQETPSG